jgi:hypothetical protein
VKLKTIILFSSNMEALRNKTAGAVRNKTAGAVRIRQLGQ